MKTKKPKIASRFALTIGDPAGIGPEIAMKAIRSLPESRRRRIVLIGDSRVLPGRRTSSMILSEYNAAKLPPKGCAAFIEIKALPPSGIIKGKCSATGGRASYAYIQKGVELCLEGKLAGIVTAPISKEALSKARIPFPGHTEMLWELSGKKRPVAMLFYSRELQVVLLTTHISLRKAIVSVRKKAIVEKLKMINNYLKPAKPIAVCGLNPHASENGLFGDEEKKEIKPAIVAARKIGIKVEGPMPADTLFTPNVRKKYGAILAMYHDQGLVGVKTASFGKCANVTLGLPFIRTSVDHGTAFDIANKGRANPSSMLFAIETAFRLNA